MKTEYLLISAFIFGYLYISEVLFTFFSEFL